MAVFGGFSARFFLEEPSLALFGSFWLLLATFLKNSPVREPPSSVAALRRAGAKRRERELGRKDRKEHKGRVWAGGPSYENIVLGTAWARRA